jgi:peptidoglycan/xylan/chitin deacetylase (PgdA/CDA1 family)
MNIASAGHRQGRIFALCGALQATLLIALQSLTAVPARAADCPGNPNALGTSRTLVVDPTEHTRIGTMQYGETLPLKDHEVVLTFDDGPLPAHSNQVLQTLASECVKATFFIIGRMAKEFPDGVRKVRDAGHTVGTHSENHPLSFNHMPIDRAMREINDGIEHTGAALGDPGAVAPFFRIPGLLRAEGVEDYLASRGIMTWSADFPADDWRHISSAQVLHLALTRLEAKGKGVLLLHDIQARTAAMLPTLLRELKARGYRIVHVVPATPDRPKTPTEPREWLLHPGATSAPVASWPSIPRFVFAKTATLPAPSLTNTDYVSDTAVLNRRDHIYRPNRFVADTVASPLEPFWPPPAERITTPVDGLPVPDRTIFQIPDMASLGIKPGPRKIQLAQRLTRLPPGRAGDITGSVTVQTSAARRQLPGSWPVGPVGLQRGPITLR